MTSPAESNIQAVALDMDGLLFDTEKLYRQVGDEVLARRGLRFCDQLQERMMGRIGVECLQQMVDFHDLDDSAQDLLEESDAIYRELLRGGVEPMPGLARWIEALRQSGLPFGLSTSSRRAFVDMILGTVEWREALAFELTGDDVSRGKPDPEIYQTAAARFGVAPENMLVLEDSGNGCAAAVNAGAWTVAIPNHLTRNQDFSGAKWIAKSLADPRLLSIIRRR